MEYEFGKPKSLDSITKDDVLENKIWLWTWEAGIEGEFDEDWQVPIKGISNITNEFTEPIITLKIPDIDLIASASFDFKKNKIYGIAIWENDNWNSINKSLIKTPFRFESLIKINGIEKVEFIMNDKNSDEALMKK